MFLELKKPNIRSNATIEEEIECIKSLKRRIKQLQDFDQNYTDDNELNIIMWQNYLLNAKEGYEEITDKHLDNNEPTYHQDQIHTEYYEIEKQFRKDSQERIITTECVSGKSYYQFHDNVIPTEQLKKLIIDRKLVLYEPNGVSKSKYEGKTYYSFAYQDSKFKSLLLCNSKLSGTPESLGLYKNAFLSVFREYLTEERIKEDINTIQEWIDEMTTNASKKLRKIKRELEKTKQATKEDPKVKIKRIIRSGYKLY